MFGAINLDGASSTSSSSNNKASGQGSYKDVFVHNRQQLGSPGEDGKVKRLGSFSRLSMYKNGEAAPQQASMSSLRKTTNNVATRSRRATGNGGKSDDEEEEFTSAVPMLY